MLELQNTMLLCIDMQGNLAQAMYNRATLFKSLAQMLSGAVVLDIPIIWTEQHPKKLGATVDEIARCMPPGLRPLEKMSFSCCGNTAIMREIKLLKCTDVMITGIETHICVYQTAADLADMGYRVHILADCVSSRKQENHAVGLEKIKSLGGTMTTTETVLFELLRTAAAPKFKDIFKIIRD